MIRKMKTMKLKIGTIFFLGLMLFIPKGNCNIETVYLKNETVYLDQDNYLKVYFIRMLNNEDVSWSFRTYDNSFKVKAGRGGNILSIDKFSDSGSFQNRLGDGFYDFWFQNIDSVSGYIEIKIWKEIPIEQESKSSIEGYNFMIIFMIISIISIISIKRLKKRFKSV